MSRESLSERIRGRVASQPWPAIEASLLERGHARIPLLLAADECGGLIDLYADGARFRKTIEMGSHAYGEGEYRYFGYPLPPLVAALRSHLYPPLRAIAARWNELLGVEADLPRTLRGFLESCHAEGQERPTPLLLRYAEGGYNRMHRDHYGPVAFPLQVTCLLSPRGGFGGGEFLLSESRPRMQSRVEAIALDRGEAVVFASDLRPVQGRRGFARASTRHGVNRLSSGERYALGVIFHDSV